MTCVVCRLCYPVHMARDTYIIHTWHGAERLQRSVAFSSYDDACKYATENNPDTDGTVCPRCDDAMFDLSTFERSFRWLGNRYAVMTREGE